jgi:hypothetical protein
VISWIHSLLHLIALKERNLLVRAVLGDPSKALQLNRSFLDKVEKALSIDRISSEAWWATDYHLSWLAGALTVYSEGVVDKRTRANQWGESNGVISHLIEGNQEDIDLITASGLDLVLVEAKGLALGMSNS